MVSARWPVRLATVEDAGEVARLLHDFNTEFNTASPGVSVLTPRLTSLLAGVSAFAVLAGDPSVSVALVTLRPHVWYEGPVAILEELYVAPELRDRGIGSTVIDLVLSTARARGVELVEINVDESDVDAMRFYERHGFTAVEPTTGEGAFYFHQELAGRQPPPPSSGTETDPSQL
ncbi:MAG: GNAT family N-acetyltransferase [Acidimicrobiia bacterium]